MVLFDKNPNYYPSYLAEPSIGVIIAEINAKMPSSCLSSPQIPIQDMQQTQLGPFMLSVYLLFRSGTTV